MWERPGPAREGKGCWQKLVQASQAGRAEDLLGAQPADDDKQSWERELALGAASIS